MDEPNLEWGTFGDVLTADVDKSYSTWLNAPEEEKGFWLRAAYRAYFGDVEAWLSFVRRSFIPQSRKVLPQYMKGDPVEYEAFFAATAPFEWNLDENGKPHKKVRKIGFLANFKGCVRLLCLTVGKTTAVADVLFQSEEWQAMKRAVKVRDGLMHPHRRADVLIGKEAGDDLRVCLSLFHSFVGIICT